VPPAVRDSSLLGSLLDGQPAAGLLAALADGIADKMNLDLGGGSGAARHSPGT
jgi:hypothetical protein